MESSQRFAITESPWFWVLAFSAMALIVLIVMGPKYGRRQANIEVKYQARERAAVEQTARNNPAASSRNNDSAAPRPYSQPGETLVPLWPLAVLLAVIALFAAFKLKRAGASLPSAASSENSSP